LEFENITRNQIFLKNLGYSDLTVHKPYNHFDFKKGGRMILVIGPMGSGKTEFSARLWRDAKIARKKSDIVAGLTSDGKTDRRNVFYIRSSLDKLRFPELPPDALAFRGGYELCGPFISFIGDSFDLEKKLDEHPEVGTWIVDEASFYDERIVFVMEEACRKKNLNFIYPTLVMNFRKEIFNTTARLLLENTSDVFPLTAYCEHMDCLEDSLNTYRYYTVDGMECPALYFDSLIIIGGDSNKQDPVEPDYCTRCDRHHYLPAKEYTFLTLKSLGSLASQGKAEPLTRELWSIKNEMGASLLFKSLNEKESEHKNDKTIILNSLKVPYISERALMFLFAEQNLITEDLFKKIVESLELDVTYLEKRLIDNNRPVNFNRTLF